MCVHMSFSFVCKLTVDVLFFPFTLQFALLFPGEAIDRESPAFSGEPLSPKESIWALYCRSMLLWNFCGRFRVPSQNEERAELATEATNEVMAIEDSLNAHSCNLDTTLIYTCREYIHKSVFFRIELVSVRC